MRDFLASRVEPMTSPRGYPEKYMR